MTDQVLIVLHQEHSTPGRVGHLLRARGLHLDIRRPALGDDLPATMADHVGAVVFGGPMSANDDLPFIRKEIEWIDVPLREGKPYLGICLGAQMLARNLGGRVRRHPDGRVEVGYYPIKPTDAGRKLLAWPERVYQWHNEGFEIETCGTLLAAGDDFPNQAFVYGERAFGIQFHPEVTLAMMHRWTVKGGARCELPGARPPFEHIEGRALYDGAVKSWLDRFIDLWLKTPNATSQGRVQPTLIAAE
jgi:GMP synthase (glutamine-hydrolysing)